MLEAAINQVNYSSPSEVQNSAPGYNPVQTDSIAIGQLGVPLSSPNTVPQFTTSSLPTTPLPSTQSSLAYEIQQLPALVKRYWYVLFLVIILLLLAYFRPNSATRTISLAGTATKQIPAASATLVVQQSAADNDKNNAVATGERNFSKLLQELKNIPGVEVSEVPSLITSGEKSAFGSLQKYQFLKVIQITVTDISQLDYVSTVLNSNDGLLLQTTYKPQALAETNSNLTAEAMIMARKDAENLAKASGSRVGKVLSVVDANTTSNSALVSASSDSAVPNLEMSKTITVTFEMHGKLFGLF